MKLLMMGVVAACQVCVLIPQAVCQENHAQPERLHMTIANPQSRGDRVALSASRIDRDLSAKGGEAILHLQGNVEVRMTTCVPARPGDRGICKGATVLHADQVDYDEKTGEMDARGNVHITPDQQP